jgi:hypothetical protein
VGGDGSLNESGLGTLVLVMDDNAKRHEWPLGLVTSVIMSHDGVVRAASVRTRCRDGERPTTLARNVRELVPLTLFDHGEARMPEMEAVAQVVLKETTEEGMHQQHDTQVIRKVSEDDHEVGTEHLPPAQVILKTAVQAPGQGLQGEPEDEIIAPGNTGIMPRGDSHEVGMDHLPAQVLLGDPGDKMNTMLEDGRGIIREDQGEQVGNRDLYSERSKLGETEKINMRMEIATGIRKFFATSEDGHNPGETSESCDYRVARMDQTPAQVPLEDQRDSAIQSPILNNDFNSSAMQKFTEKTEIITKTITNNNQEIPDTDNLERAKCLQKSPHPVAKPKKGSGNTENEKQQSSDKIKVLPDGIMEKEIKNCRKTPKGEGSTMEMSGNDGTMEERTPGAKDQQRDKKQDIAPNIASIESNGDNDKVRLQENEIQETVTLCRKAPKSRKYKTEVEKLREMQVDFEAKQGRRRSVTVVDSEMVNKVESNKTQINGDGPKTGLVE